MNDEQSRQPLGTADDQDNYTNGGGNGNESGLDSPELASLPGAAGNPVAPEGQESEAPQEASIDAQPQADDVLPPDSDMAGQMNGADGTAVDSVDAADVADVADMADAADTTDAADISGQATDLDSAVSTDADARDTTDVETGMDAGASDAFGPVPDTSDTDLEDTLSVEDAATGVPEQPVQQATATDESAIAAPSSQGEFSDAPAQAQEAVQDELELGEAQEPEQGEMVVRTTRDRMADVAPNASMEDLLKASEQQYRTLKHGDVVEGTVMRVGRDEIMVDIGAKTEGIIPSHELQSMTEEEREATQVGDTLLVSVVQPENAEGHAVLSLDRARQEKSWRDLQKQFEAGEVIQAKVTGHNKGGLLVNLEGVRGFVPASQVSSMPAGEANKQAEMARLQNQTLPLKIIEINRNRNRLILSERQAVQEQREGMRTRLLKELEPGQVRPGTVTSICDFGAFVDIGGADGLIHLSELSWKRVAHPSEILHVGDRINVYVLSVDPNERKIALSLKRTQPEPWSTITDHYQLGQIVRGTITQLTSFGAFARLEDGIEGLIHVSELAEGRVAHPRNVVNEGDVVDLKVIRIDPARKRIGLSLKRVNEDTEAGPEEQTQEQGEEERGPQAAAPREREERQPRSRSREASHQASERAEQPRPTPAQPKPDEQSDQEFPGALAQALAGYSQANETTQAPKTSALATDAALVPSDVAQDESGAIDAAAPQADVAEPEASMPSASEMETAEESAAATDSVDIAPAESDAVSDASLADVTATDLDSAVDTDVSEATGTDTGEAPDASPSDVAATDSSDIDDTGINEVAADDMDSAVDTDAEDSGAPSGSEGEPSVTDSDQSATESKAQES
jgi:small subunit ribosomal protein S1